MKIAVCSGGNTLDSLVDPRFGRSANFIIVDSDTMEFTIEPNPGVAMGQGAGIQAAQLLAGKGVQAVVAGNFGPNAFQVLSAAGIRIYQSPGGTVRQSVEQLKSGLLPELTDANVAAHYGMGQGFQPGGGISGGRGMGGGGRGRGGGCRGRGGGCRGRGGGGRGRGGF